MTRPGGPIVVGVSPNTGSPAALRWAAEEAALRGTKLRAVLAWRPPRAPAAPGGRPPATVVSTASTDHAAVAEEALRGYVAKALGSDDAVECRAVKGNAVSALLAAAADAQLVVVGEPRPGRVAAVRASLVAPVLIAQAKCPVVAMPGAVGANAS
jgi:nucleotide-binding universal stress UspA family protein